MNFMNEVITSCFDVRDYRINAATNFPATYICPVLIPIKNQGTKPTCVAHALASLVEYHNKVQTKKQNTFSTEFIYGLRDVGYYVGDGMMIRDGLNTICKYGDTYKKDCSGNNDVKQAMENVSSRIDNLKDLAYPHRISAYYRCTTEDEIKTALLEHGPVVASMNTYENAVIFNDQYIADDRSKSGRHCVLIVGWNNYGWLVHNSWGEGYAGDGKFTLPFDYKLNEAWGVTDNIVDDLESSIITKKTENKFTKILYIIYNKLANLWLKLVRKG